MGRLPSRQSARSLEVVSSTQPQDILLDLLACCAACTVNAVQSKSDSVDNERSLHADRLAAALRLDMAVWFTPTAANYFRRISKTGILAAFQE